MKTARGMPVGAGYQRVTRESRCGLTTTIGVICVIVAVATIMSMENERRDGSSESEGDNHKQDEPAQDPTMRYATTWIKIYNQVYQRLELCEGDIECALNDAVHEGDLDGGLVGLLLEDKIDLTMVNNNALSAGVIAHRRDIIDHLLQSESVDVTHTDNYPFMMAVSINSLETVERFLQDDRIRSKVDFPRVIDWAASLDQSDMVTLLTLYRDGAESVE